MCRAILMGVFSIFLASSAVWAVSFSADSITPTIMEKSDGGKFYFKEKGTYRSDGMGMISIVKDSLIYSIVTDTKKYVTMKFDEVQKENPMGIWGDAMEMIEMNKLRKVGNEKIQGYSCVIYEGGVKFHESQPPAPVKLWYSKKLNNMIKQEITIQPMGKIVTSLVNIKEEKLDDSLFEVPEGYTKVDDMAEAMGMEGLGNFNMGAMKNDHGNGGGMPSEEDMKKMMEQMQKMMKQ